MITAKQNTDVVNRLVQDWRLGPATTSVDKYANKAYWSGIAKAWGISEEMLKEMESIPINALDRDGGGRGWCHKFEFICHNLRTCQAWEKKDYYPPEGEED